MKTIEQLTKNGYYYVNTNITNVNFPKPKAAATKGYTLIPLEKYTSSEECLEIIKNAGCRPATIYELALLKENHPEVFIKGKWHLAFGSVWENKVPYVYASSDGDFLFDLDDWDGDWYSGSVLVCFCDNQPLETLALKEDISSLDPLSDETAITYLKSKGYKITRLEEKEY